MELEEFKKYWTEELENEFQDNQHSPQHINEMVMKTRTMMNKIVKTNKFWLYTCYVSVLLISLTIAVSFIEFNNHPENFPPDFVWYNLFLLVFILITTLLYYAQYSIFHLKNADINLRLAIEKIVDRFNDFYRLSFGINIILFPFIFYIVLSTSSASILSDLSTGIKILAALVLSGIGLWGNHLYYKKTYFSWINRMKSNLQELEED